MATQGILVYSLDVGQGMCTYVEIYDTDNKLTNTLLFDLGSSKHSTEAGGPTVAFLAQQINKRKPTPFIDAVFISHKDSDHVNLISNLLKALPGVGVGMVRYGGRYNWYKKSKSNILNDLKARCASPDNVKGFPVGVSDFDPDLGFFDYLWDENDVTVHLVTVNTPYKKEKLGDPESGMSSNPDGIQANSKSLVCLVRYKASDFFISGDATFETIIYMNGILQTQKLGWVKMLLLPHHGSRKTTFGLPSTAAPISVSASTAVNTFARKMSSKTLIASADTKHSHPSLDTIQLFQNYSDKGNPWWKDDNLDGNRHYLTAYLDLNLGIGGPQKGQYKSFQTTENVYSTLYCNGKTIGKFSYPPFAKLPPPDLNSMNVDVEFPWGMNWIYTVPAGGGITLKGVSSNRVSALRMHETSFDLVMADEAPPESPREEEPCLTAITGEKKLVCESSLPVFRSAREEALPPVSEAGSSGISRLRTIP